MSKEIFQDITVLALEQATVAPYLSYRLAQDGMKVIRVENPAMPDPNRFIGDNSLDEEGMYSYFLAINAGKKAITLNLAEKKGRELLKDLLTSIPVDIFITNQLPRNYEKLGIDYNILKEVKKDLVWVGITGFGPQSNEAAYDPILQARSGLMELTGEKEGNPVVTGIPLPDMGTSEHTYGMIMKALLKRALTGEGSRIDMSMYLSSVSWLTVPVCLSKSFGKHITRRGNTHEFFAPVSVYRTRDGYVYVAVGNDRQWESVTSIDAFSHLADEKFRRNAGRIADVENLNQAIEEVTVNFTTDELIKLFNEAKVAISRVNTIEEVLEEPLVKDNYLFSRDRKSGMGLTMSPPPYMTAYLEAVERNLTFPPRLGEHNEEIFGEALGLSAAELKAFRDSKII